MKNNAITLKVLFLLFILFNVSCANDDTCYESSLPVNFPLKIKLISIGGENLLDDDNFNLSLLEITDSFNSSTERTFSQVEENGELLITFQAVNMDSANFEYDGEDKFYFGFHDIERQTVNCTTQVTNYKALRVNGDLVCDCSIEDILVITLDL